MSKKGKEAPEACDSTKGIINNNTTPEYNKLLDGSSLPGCFGEYDCPESLTESDGCRSCLYRLPCARMSAQERL